ncbi:hypothetical protein CLAIMM_14317 [Cladophialophora immunda]|nr:hypothetical protein CLAIMM_14317 [Cladophialophora immunda]
MKQHKPSNGASKAAGPNKHPTTPDPGAMNRKPADDGNPSSHPRGRRLPASPTRRLRHAAANRPGFWRNKEDAVNDGRGPWHKQARAAISSMYEEIGVKGLRFTIEKDVKPSSLASVDLPAGERSVQRTYTPPVMPPLSLWPNTANSPESPVLH